MSSIIIDYEGIDDKIDSYLEEIMEEYEDTVGGLPTFGETDLMYLYCHIEHLSFFGRIAISVVIRRLEDFDANLTECNISKLQPLTHEIIRKFLQDELEYVYEAHNLENMNEEESSIDDSDTEYDDSENESLSD